MLFKKNTTVYTLNLLDRDGKTLYEGPLKEYRLPENAVLELSNEFFSDPEPCEIHRGAVHMRVYMELIDLCASGAPVKIAGLDERTRGYFPPDADRVTITEEKR